MKILRRYRSLLGRTMVFLMAWWQISQPLNSLHAATLFWDSDASAGNLVTEGSGNWVPGTTVTFFNPATNAETATSATDVAVFGSGGSLGSPATISVSTGSIAGLVFGASSNNGYSLIGSSTGQTLTIGGTGFTNGIAVSSGAQATSMGNADLSLKLGAAQSWLSGSANLLTIGGNIDLNGFGLTLGAHSSGGILLSGNITGTLVGITVNSTGPGTVTLSGNNSYTGTTLLSNGILRATTNANALGGVGSALQLNGGMLQLSGGFNFANNTAVGGNTTITSGSGSAVGATNTLGTLSIGAQRLTVTGGSSVTSGTAGLTFGATTLTGTSIFTVNNPAGGGTTQLSLGAVTNAANTATINGNGNVIQTGVWGSGAGGITYNGNGTLTLNQANTYTGATTVAGGTVIAKDDAGALGAAGATLMLLGGNLKVTNASNGLGTAGITLTAAGVTTLGATSTITSDVNVASTVGNTQIFTGGLTTSGQQLSIMRGANATGTAGITFQGTTTLGAIANSGTTFDVGANTNLTIGSLSGVASFRKQGLGTLTLGAVETGTRASGHAYVFGGTLALGASQTGAADSLGSTAAPVIVLFNNATNTAGTTLDIATGTTAGTGILAHPTTILGNATILSNSNTPGTAGFTQTLGALTVLGSNTITIDKGTNVTGTTAAVAFGAATTNAATVFTTASNGATALSFTSTLGNGGYTTTFNGAGNVTITGALSGGGGLIFNGTNASTTLTLTAANTYVGGTSITGGTVTLGNATSLGTFSAVTPTPYVVMTNGSTLNLNSATVTVNAGTSLLAISAAAGTIIQNGSTATASTLTLLPGANYTSSIGANMANGGTATLGLTINGAGAVSLSGSNTYTGTTTLTAGQLNVNSVGALSSSSAMTLTAGTIDNTSAGSVVSTYSNTITLGTGGFTYGGSKDLSLGSATISAAGSRVVTLMGTSGSTLTVGTWNNNFATSSTTIKALPDSNSTLSIGTLISTSTGTVATILGNGNFRVTNGIQPGVPTAASVVYSSAGTLTLSGASTYTGATTFNSGTFILDATPVGGASLVSGNVATFGGGTFIFKGDAIGTGQTLGAITLAAAGASSIQVVGGASGTTLTLGTMTDATNNSMMNIVLSGTSPVVTSTTAVSANGIFGTRAAITVTTGGTTEFAGKSGTSIVQYTGQTAFTGTTTGAATNYSVADSQTLTTAASTPNTIKITTSTSGQFLDLDTNTMKITSGGILFTGADAYEIKGTNAAALSSGTSATTADLIVHNFGSGVLTISAVIANGGSGAQVLSVDGPGKTALTGVNTYTGVTQAGGGAVLSINSNDSLGLFTTGATLTLNNATLQATGTFALDNAGANIRAIVLAPGGGTFDVTGSNTLTVLGVISSTGSLTKTGTGTLLLTGADTYTGGFTNIQNGTLQTGGAAGTIAATNIVVLGNGANSGKLILGDATNTKSQTVAGLITLGTNAANSSVQGGNAGGNSTLTYTGTVAVPTTFAGSLGSGTAGASAANNLALTITAGELTLSGNNTFTGGVQITPAAAGYAVLNINSANAIGTGTLNLAGTAITTGALVLDNTSNSPLTLTTGNSITIGNTVTFGGSASLNFGTGSTVTEAASRVVNLLGAPSSTSVLTFDKWNMSAAALTLTVNAQQGSGTALNIGTFDLNTGTTGAANLIAGNGNVNITLLKATATATPFTYSGTGILTVNSATYGGLTSITGAGGRLMLGADNALPANGLTMTNGVFDLNGHNQSNVGKLTLTAPALITNTSGGAAVTFTALDSATSTGNIAGNLNAVIGLAGTSAASAWTGNITNTGDLTLRNDTTTLALLSFISSTTLPTIIQNGGNLNLINNAPAGAAITLSNPLINPTGAITNSGNGAGTTLISGGIGSNVTAINQNSASSIFNVNTGVGGSLYLQGAANLTTTITSNAAGAFTFGAGQVNGIGNLSVVSTASIGGAITFSALPNFMGNLTFTSDSSNNITVSSATINNSGTITNNGSGTNTTTISGIIGLPVTGVIQNSASSSLSLGGANTFLGGISVLSGKLYGITSTTAAFGAAGNVITLGNTTGSSAASLLVGITASTFNNPIVLATNANNPVLTVGNSDTANTAAITFSGGVTGNNNLVINNSFVGASAANTVTFSVLPVNNAGTVTLTGTSTGLTTISGGIGANVTQIIENSNSSALTISTNALTVNPGGTTIINNSTGTNLLTLSGGTNGVGDLILQNNTTTANGITVSTGTLNHSGAITSNTTAGTGITLISAPIGGNVTAINANSNTSQLSVTGAVTLAGNTLTVTSNNTNATATAFATGVIGGTGTLVFNANNTNNITVANAVTPTGTFVIINSGTGTGSVTLNTGVIGGGASTSILQNSTTSTLILGGANTFSGGVTIKAGTVIGNATLAYGTTSTVTVGDSGGNNLAASMLVGTTGLTLANPIVLASTTTGMLTVGNSNNIAAATFSGGVTGSNNLVIANNSTGASTITFSTNTLNNTGTITNTGTSTGATTISAVIGSNVTGVIQNSTTSALTLSAANTSFSGSVIVKAGTINNSNNGGAVFGTGTITLGDSVLNSSNVFLNYLTNAGVTANNIVLADRSTATGTLTIGIPGSSVGATLSGSITGNNDLVINNSTIGTTGRPTFTGTGANGVNNSGTVTLIGTNSGTTVATTITSVGSNVTGVAIGSGSTGYTPLTITALAVNSGGTTLSNSASGPGTIAVLTVSGGITGTGNLILSNNNSTITNGIQLTTVAVNNVGTITNQGTGTGAVLISAVIGTNVTGLIQNSATSGLTLSGVNTYTGDTLVSLGTLTLGGTSALGGSTLDTSGAGTISWFAGTNNLGGLKGNDNITPNQLLSIGANGQNTTYSGVLDGTGGLTKVGSGTLTLSGANTYAGLTTVTAGTLKLSGIGTIKTGNALTIGASGSFDLNGINQTFGLVTNGGTTNGITNSGSTATLTIGDGSTGAGSFTGALNVIWNQSGSSTTLTGSWSNVGNITLNANGAGTMGLTTGTVNNTGTITNSGSNSGTTTISAVIGSNVTGVVQNSTTSKMILTNGNNAFTSTGGNLGVVIKSGTLQGSQNTAGQITSLGLGTVTLGDTGGSKDATLEAQGSSPTYANPILLGTTSGVLTIQSANSNVTAVFSGTITGTHDLIFATGIINTSTSGLTFSNLVNNVGTLTNSVGAGATGLLTFSGGIGSNVGSILHSSAGGLTLSTNSINNVGNLTFSGSGTGVVTVSAGVNTTGAILNNGATTGTTTISGIIANSVTSITQNSATSKLTISGSDNSTFGGLIKVINGTLTGAAATNVFGSNTAANSITLGDASTLSTGATLSSAFAAFVANNPITIVGNSNGGVLTISNAGTTSTNTSTWNGLITTNSPFTVTEAGGAVTTGSMTFTGGVANGSGTGNDLSIVVGSLITSGDITFSGSTSINNAGQILVSGGSASATTADVVISAPIGSNVTNITDTRTYAAGTGTGTFTLSGATVANTGNITFSGSGASIVTFSAAAINTTGTITNNGTTTGGTTISGALGSTVGLVTQNSATSLMTISGVNTAFTGGIKIINGTVNATSAVNSLGTSANTFTLGDSTTPTGATSTLLLVNGATYNPAFVINRNSGNDQGVMSIGAGSSATAILSSGITMSAPLTLQSTTWTTGSLTVNGAISQGTGTGNDLNIVINGTSGFVNLTNSVNMVGAIKANINDTLANTSTISGPIGSNVTGVTLNQVGAGASTLVLSGNNSTFAGGVTVKAGTVRGTTSANAFGTGTITIGDTTGILDATLSGGLAGTFANAITVVSGSSGTATITSSLAGTIFGGAVTLNKDVTIQGGGTTLSLTMGGSFTGTGSINIAGSGTTGAVTLSGANINTIGSITNSATYTSPTLISANIGSNVTNLVQNSASSVLNLTGTSIAYTGATTVSAGTLNITGGTAAPLVTSAITVAGGATLNLVNTAGQTVNLGSGTINLGAGAGTTTLNFDIGSLTAYDHFTTTGAATTANSVLFNLTGIGGIQAGTYNLLAASAGLAGASYSVGTFTNAGGFAYTLAASGTAVQLNATALATNLYWKGGVSGNPNSWAAFGAGLTTNFTTDLGGGTNALGTPGSGNTVNFSATGAGAAVSTTLDGPFTVNDLVFNSNVTPTSVLIAPGTGGTLTIAPSSSAVGITVGASSGAVTISAPVTLGASQTWTVNGTGAASLTVSGAIAGTGVNGLTINGSNGGIVFLSAAAGQNTYSGTTTVSNGGILQSGATNSFSANSAFTVNGTGILRLNGVANTIFSLAGNGTVENGGAATTLSVGAGGGSGVFSGLIQNGGANALGITKVGNGTLELSGTNTYTGNTVVSGGTLNLTGTWTGGTGVLAYGGTAANTLVNVSNNITAGTTSGSSVAGAVAVYKQTAGTVTLTPAATSSHFVAGTAGYGYFELSGGSYSTTTATGRFSVVNGAGTGVVYVGGGGTPTLNVQDYLMGAYNGVGATSSITIGPGGTINHTGANQVAVTWASNNVYGILNLAGGLLNTAGTPVSFGSTTQTGATGIMNFAAGTLSTNVAISNLSTAGTGTANYINFAGGTLKTGAAVASMLPVSNAFVSTRIFGAITNNSNVNADHSAFNTAIGATQNFTGGLTIDTNGFNSGIAATSNLLGAAGSGVQQSSLSVTGGSGYIGAPMVQFTGGTLATNGTPAAGYAIISGGAVLGIVITNPGEYTAAPTVTLTGGGGTGASVTVGTLVANTSGGLTKIGIGTLTLNSTASTFGGPLTISSGTVASATFNDIGTAGALGSGDATSSATNAASIVLDGGTLQFTGASVQTTDRLFTLTTNGGTLDASGTSTNTMTFSNTNAIALSGTGTHTLTLTGTNTSANTLAALITNQGGNATTVNKTGAGLWVLSNGSNSYTGGTNINAGTLSFTAGALGTTGSITFTGNSTLQWNGHATDRSARIVITNGVTGTIDTNGNNVIFANAVGTTGGTAAVLNKAGAGSLTLNAAATHTGGTTLTAGTLNIGNAAALGSGTFTVLGGTFDNTTGGAAALTGNPAVTLGGNFAFAGSSDLNLGTGAVSMTAVRTVDITGTLTIAGAITGAGNFIKNGAGTLYLAGDNTAMTGNPLTINAGTVKIDNEAALGPVANDVTFGTGGGTLQITTGFTPNVGKFFTMTAAGGGTIQIDSGTLVESIANQFIAVGAGGGLIKSGAGTLNLALSNSSFDGLGVGANGATNVGFRVDAGLLLLTGSSNNVVGDVNPNTMTMQLNGGNLTIQTDTASIARANLWVSSAATLTVDRAIAGIGIAQTIGTNAAGTIGLTMGVGSSVLNIAGGSNITSGTEAVTFTQGTLLLANPTFNVTNASGGGALSLTLNAFNDNGTARTITKQGNGTMILASAATSLVSGTQLVITGGTVNSNSATALGSLAAVKLADSTVFNVGVSQTIGSLGDSGSPTLNNASVVIGNGFTLTTGTANSSQQFSGIISGGNATSALVKTGTGTLTLTNVSTYAGGTTIQNGALLLAGGDNRLVQSGVITLGDGVSTSGKLILGSSSPRTQQLNQTGATSILSTVGSVQLSNSVVGGAAGGTSSGTPVNNSVLILNIATGKLDVYNGLIGWDGTGSVGFQNNINLVKQGGGILELSGDLTYWTGTTDHSPALPNTIDFATDSTRPELILSGGVLRLDSGMKLNTLVRNTGGVINDLGAIYGSNYFLIQTGGLIALSNTSDSFSNSGITSTSHGVAALNIAGNTGVVNFAGSDMYLGAVGARIYSNSPLAAGSGSTYRLGGGAGWQSLGTASVDGSGGYLQVSTANVITGANKVIIGDNGTYGLFGRNSIVEFTAAQNYSGTTTLAGGTFVFSNTSALGTNTSPGSLIFDGGILRYTAATAATDLSGQMVIDSGATIATNGQNVTFGTGIANAATGTSGLGNGGLTKIGAGTLTLYKANTYTGGTIVSGGTLALDFNQVGASADAILNNATGFGFYGGTLNANAVGGTTVNNQRFTVTGVVQGGNTLNLTTATAFSGGGALNVGLGLLLRASGSGLNIVEGSNVTLGTTGNVTTTTLNSAASILGGWATVNGKDWAVSGATQSTSVTWTGSGANTISIGGLANDSRVSFSGTVPGGLTNTQAYYVVNSTGSDFQVAASVGGAAITLTDSGATATVNKSGLITALGSYVSDTWAAGNNTTVTGSSSPTSGSTTSSLRFNVAATSTVTLAGTNTLTSGGILVTNNVGAFTQTITGGTLTTGGGELVINNFNATVANSLTIASILDASINGLTKNGVGTVVLGTATNSYSGQTVINDGILSMDAQARYGNTTGFTLNGGQLRWTAASNLPKVFTLGLNGGTLNITSGGNQQIGTAADILLFQDYGARTLTLNSVVDRKQTFNFIIGDNGGPTSLVIAGAGDTSYMVMNANNTYTGTTTISRGIYQLATSGALPGGLGGTTLTSSNTGGGNLIFSATGANRAILELTDASGGFFRSVGTGFDQVQWTGNGGFSNASTTQNLTVNLGGAASTIVWGTTTGFVPGASALQFGQSAGNSNSVGTFGIDFKNGLDLNGGTRTVNVDSTNAVIEAILSGNLSNTSGTAAVFTKTGLGALQLSGTNNTGTSGTLTTTVSGGYLVLSNATSAVAGINGDTTSRSITVGANGAVVQPGSTDLNTLLGRINSASSGVVAFDTSSSVNIDLSSSGHNLANVYLGAYSSPGGTPIYYNGIITPNSNTYKFANATLASPGAAIGSVGTAVQVAYNLFVLNGTNMLRDSGSVRSAIFGGNSTAQGGTGTIYVTGYNTYTGGTTIGEATGAAATTTNIGIGNNSALGTGLVTLNDGRVASLNGDHTLSNNLKTTSTTGNVSVGGNLATEGVVNNGSITFIGTADFSSLTTGGIFTRGVNNVAIFLGDVKTNASNNLSLVTSTNGPVTFVEFLTTPAGASGATGFNTAKTMNAGNKGFNYPGANPGGAGIVIDSAGSLGPAPSANVANFFNLGAITNATLEVLPGITSTITLSANEGLTNSSGNLFAFTVNGAPTINDSTATATNGLIGNSSLTFNGVMSGTSSGAPALNKLGYGTLTLTGVNTASGLLTAANGIAIEAGTLQLSFANATAGQSLFSATGGTGGTIPIGVLLGTSAFPGNVGLSSTFATPGVTLALLGKSGQANSQTFGAVTNAARDNNITINSNGGTVDLTLGLITNTLGGTIAVTLPSAGTFAIGATNTTLASGSGTSGTGAGLLVDANLNPYVIVGSNEWGAKDGSNNVVAGSSIGGFYTPNTGAAFTVNTNADLTTAATLSAASTTVNSLRLNTASALTLNLGGNTLITGGILMGTGTGTNNQVISNGTLQGVATKNLAIYQANASGTLTISALIAGTTIALSKAGPGTLILTNNNTYTGVTYFNGGVISVSTVANAGAQPLGAATNAAANWVFNGGTLQFTGGNGSTDHGATFNSVSAIDVTQSGTTLILQSSTIAITGLANTPGILRKIGAGTLQIGPGTTANNANLSVEVTAGTLLLNKTGTTGFALSQANGAALIIDSGATAKVQTGAAASNGTTLGQIDITSSVVANGTFDLNSVTQTFDGLAGSGTVTSAAGTPTLNLGSNNDAAISAWTVAAAAAGVASTGLNNFTGNITGTIALNKIGAGTQILSGTGNTYGGGTTVTSGTLQLAAANVLPGTTDVTIVGTTVVGGLVVPGNLDLGGFNQTIDGLSSGTGATVTNTPTLAFTGGIWQANGATSGSVTSILLVGNGNESTATFAGVLQDGFTVIPVAGSGAGTGVTGILALTKTGTGTQTLSGANTASGTLTVNGGAMLLNTIGSNAWSGHVVVNSSGTLQLVLSNQILDSKTLTVSGGTFDLNGKTETVAGASLTSGGTIVDGLGGGVLTSTADFDLQSGSASAVLSGAVGATKTTSGTVILSGANTYTGVTTISEGTISASNIVVSGGSSHLGNAGSSVILGDATHKGILSYTGNSATYIRGFTVNAVGSPGTELEFAL